MSNTFCPDVIVFLCHNCIPEGENLPRQFQEDGIRVKVVEAPCSGKTDALYLFHLFEAGGAGLCVIACPPGKCQLAQGNYRARIRVQTVQRLLSEIGLERERVELVQSSADDPPGHLESLIREAVQRFRALGENPLRGQGQV